MYFPTQIANIDEPYINQAESERMSIFFEWFMPKHSLCYQMRAISNPQKQEGTRPVSKYWKDRRYCCSDRVGSGEFQASAVRGTDGMDKAWRFIEPCVADFQLLTQHSSKYTGSETEMYLSHLTNARFKD
jgi:hypothetical protein